MKPTPSVNPRLPVSHDPVVEDQQLQSFKDFIASKTWTFAKTMPEIPHYYVVRDYLSEAEKELFDAFVSFIKLKGYTAKFYTKDYTYFEIEGFKYWQDGNILNRAELTKTG